MSRPTCGTIFSPEMSDDLIYSETVTSNRTTAVFLWAASLFLLLCVGRVNAGRRDALAVIFFIIFSLALFYAMNFRVLKIRLGVLALRLQFGLFKWVVPLGNVEQAGLDELPALLRYGGAGVHLMFVRKRYRVSFNFLEHPRVVVALNQKQGWVQDISFSTLRPKTVARLIEVAAQAGAKPAAQPGDAKDGSLLSA